MHFKIAVVTLNQWALDFEGNTRRIIESIVESQSSGAVYRLGPELEISGYSVEDGFYDGDTVFHCWRALNEILERTEDLDIVIDVGMPVHFKSLYNCRVVCHRGKVLFIRAKTNLANEGIYRESRHFDAWPASAGLVPFKLPSCIPQERGKYVPFGSDFVLDLYNLNPCSALRVGWEICQELWETKNASAGLFSDFGCHLVVNSSGSYWELRKLDNVETMIQGISLRAGACYAYSNLVGCDGQRFVFSGKSCIFDRGNLVALMRVNPSSLFREKHIIYHSIEPEEISEYQAQHGIRPKNAFDNHHKVWNLSKGALTCGRMDNSFKILALELQSSAQQTCHKTVKITPGEDLLAGNLSAHIRFEEEINYYVSLWLWDYLRRSGMRGFMIPLSGGLDSCCVATLVYCLSNHLHKLIVEQDDRVMSYFQKSHRMTSDHIKAKLTNPKSICGLILRCCYLSTRHSGQATESRARELCQSIGADFSVVSIDDIYEQCRRSGPTTDITEYQANLLDQNLQARLRMTMTYFLSAGDRIVLATGNVDEAIMGYLTKYDCSSADINPIGGLCKEDLKSFLNYCTALFCDQRELVNVLDEIIATPPSAELTGPEQRDEDEMGITYEEISVLGKVRRGIYGCCGPRGAFQRVWQNRYKPPFSSKIRCLRNPSSEGHLVAAELATLIKRFYSRYTRNRHKLTVLTPALHAETYSPDDNRFDHRQFLFPPMSKQFECIDEMVSNIEKFGTIHKFTETKTESNMDMEM